MRASRLAAAAVVLAFVVVLLWLVSRVLTPFLIAMAVAAVLDPALQRLQRRGLPRSYGVLIVYVVFFTLMGSLLFWLLPIIVAEGEALARQWPAYIDQARKLWVSISSHDLVERLRLPIPRTAAELSATLEEVAKTEGPKMLRRLLGGLSGTIGFLLNVIVMLIATFYMLNDWPKMKQRAIHVVPPQYREGVAEVMEKVGTVFLGYLRGLIVLCCTYGVTVTCVLLLLDQIPGIEASYPFLLGMLAALLYAVPYIGTLLLTLTVALVTLMAPGGNLVSAVVVTAVVLGLNLTLFDTVLTPRILGRFTGLNPLAALFAILAGSELFGLVGFILGVPVAASLYIIASALYPPLSERLPSTASVPPRQETAAG
ncbi:MAG: AI-2E family transporter [Armatimonadota bacterium]|nr:MAG: AI-2E family transporter [Armatimonadota bacterium]